MTNCTITVSPPAQTTRYIIGSRLLENLHTLPIFTASTYDQFLLLSDETVYGHFGHTLTASLEHLGVPITSSIVAAGEKSKRFETIQSCVRPFFEKGLTRRSCVVALGGGMITDLAGFVASILLRGIDCIYLPTTLLAHVDAAIGGKTGVDYWMDETRMYKNMIGTIRQPAAVISDIDSLKTLPAAEITNGLGEMVKYWIGWGKPTVEELKGIRAGRQDEVLKIINECQHIKLDIIQRDPYETRGIREKLNLGHTIGHAIESAAQGTYSHGQAVAIGCVAAAKLSVAVGMLKQETYDTIEKTVASLELPIRATGVSISRIMERMRMDKKGGTFVLIRDIGKLETGIGVETEDVRRVISHTVS